MKNNEEIKQAVIEWDVNNWSNVLNHWSTALRSLDKHTARILCLGERNGGLSLWFALQGFSVICSDFGGPKEVAKKMHAQYGVSDRIEYADLNIFSLSYSPETFDIVACKSVIGGLKLDYKDKRTRTLQNQKLAIDEVRRVLKTGGYFLGAENMRGSLVHQWGRNVLKGKNIGWRHFQVDELRWLMQNFTDSDIRFFGFIGSYYPIPLFNSIFGKIDVLLTKLLPKNLLYIGFIWARK